MMAEAVRLTGLMLAASAAAIAGWASAATPGENRRSNSAAVVADLTVLADKRETKLQRTPIAITAFDAARRDAIGIETVGEIADFTPGLDYATSSDRMTLRGVGRTTNVLSADTPVANYDDGLYETFAVAAGRSSLELDRVEVLRGPQGTLSGRNALAGALDEITNRPTRAPFAEMRLTAGNYGHLTLEGDVSGPLNDDWAYRLYGSWDDQTKGWIHNVVPGVADSGNVIDEWYVDGQIQGRFGDRLEMWTKVQLARWRNGSGGPGADAGGWTKAGPFTAEFPPGALGVSANYACSPSFPGSAVINVSPLGCVNPGLTTPWREALARPTRVTLPISALIDSQWTWHADGFDLKYIGGGAYYDYVNEGGAGVIRSLQLPVATGGDFLGSGFGTCFLANLLGSACSSLTVNFDDRPRYEEKNGFFSNELTFISTGSGSLQWVAGLYQFHQHYRQPTSDVNPGQPQLNGPFAGVCFQYGPICAPQTNFAVFQSDPSLSADTLAVYGQIDWRVRAQLRLTLGLRYSYDRKYGYERARVLCFASPDCLSGDPTSDDTPEDLGTFFPTIDFTQVPGVIDDGPPGGPLPKGVTGVTTYDPATGFAERRYDASWAAPSGVVGAEWTPDDATLAYAKYGRGYKSGGFNIGVFQAVTPEPWTDAEFVNSFEVGLKKTFARQLTIDLAAFWYDYRGLQIPISVIATAGGQAQNFGAFYNVPRSVSRGVELEALWSPRPRLVVSLSYSYLDAFVREGVGEDPADPNAMAPGAKPLFTGDQCAAAALTGNPVCAPDVFTATPAQGGNSPPIPGDAGQGWNIPQSLAGQRLPNAPRNKLAVNVLYTFHLPLGDLTPSVSYLWRDVTYGVFFTRPYNIAPAWDQWDARLSWRSANGRFEAIAFVKNAFNTIGYEQGANGSRLAGTTDVLQPDGSYRPINYVQGVNGPAGFNDKVAGANPMGIVTTYFPNPPRTFGLELRYRFFD